MKTEGVRDPIAAEVDAVSPAGVVPSPPGSDEARPAVRVARPSVWIIDDDETSLVLGAELLADQGFRVETFNACGRALDATRSSRPDIIVLDVMMPGMSGFELCSRLRSDPGTAEIPVLMVTSLNDPASIARGYDVGATNFATKPIHWIAEGHRLRYMLRAAETTARLRAAERVARDAKEDWERTFDAISDVVTLLDHDLTIVRANTAAGKAARRPLDGILGRKCFEVFMGSDAPCPECPVVEALGTRRRIAAERHYATPNATCMVIGAPVPDPGGQAQRAVHIARDLTDQKALEAQYLQAQKMEAVGTLASGIAHDFNNILAVVRSYAEQLRRDFQDDGETAEMVDGILDASGRGAALARQLLTFSRKAPGRSEKESVRLNELVRDMATLITRVVPTNVGVRTVLDDDLRSVLGAADQLDQVLMNLATNALHAMPQGGVLGLQTRTVEIEPEDCRHITGIEPGTFACLVVSDTGHGMPQETMRRMFEPFFTTKEVGKGTGLGLSVVYGIVRDHGGTISCSSEVGSGTTFSIYFPVPSGEAKASVPTLSRAARRARGGTETILVVDDDVSARAALRTALRGVGYSVVVAADAESALGRCVEGSGIGLAIVDHGLPGMDGWECLRRLRAVAPGVRGVLNVGPGEAERDRARADGWVDVLRRPFGVDELLEVVRGSFDRPSVRRGAA